MMGAGVQTRTASDPRPCVEAFFRTRRNRVFRYRSRRVGGGGENPCPSALASAAPLSKRYPLPKTEI